MVSSLYARRKGWGLCVCSLPGWMWPINQKKKCKKKIAKNLESDQSSVNKQTETIHSEQSLHSSSMMNAHLKVHFNFCYLSSSFIIYFAYNRKCSMCRISHFEMKWNKSYSGNVLRIQHTSANYHESWSLLENWGVNFVNSYFKEKHCFIKLYPRSTGITTAEKKHHLHYEHWTVNCI